MNFGRIPRAFRSASAALNATLLSPSSSTGTPTIFAADRDAGFLVLEDLGNELVVDGEPPRPIEARYEVATDLLAALHRNPLPDVLPVEPGVDYRLPHFDMGALLIEVELLPDWYLPKMRAEISDQARAEYLSLWREHYIESAFRND